MQFTKKIKHTIFLSLILLLSSMLYAQEDEETDIDSDSISVESVQKEKKFQFLNFFRKKNKNTESLEDATDEEEYEPSDDSEIEEKGFFSFLKRKKKSEPNDSILTDIDTVNTKDSVIPDKKFRLFNRNKVDTSGATGAKPDKIWPGKWVNMNAQEQDSLLRAWDSYDKEHYREKYAFTRKEVDIALKRDRNFLEKQIYKRARNKPFRHQKKLISRQNKRYKKTLRYDRLNKSETAPTDSLSDGRQYQTVNKRYKREAKKEAIRKNNIVIKYNRKEDRLRRRYELSDNEMLVLNKGKGMQLRGSELLVFNRARKKQENFTEKLLKLRKKRSFNLQSDNVQERMKNHEKKLKLRDKEIFNKLFKKRKEKRDNKHDSSEFPKRYHT